MGLKGTICSVYMYALIVGQGHLYTCTLLTAYLLRAWWIEVEWVWNSQIYFLHGWYLYRQHCTCSCWPI